MRLCCRLPAWSTPFLDAGLAERGQLASRQGASILAGKQRGGPAPDSPGFLQT